MAVMLNPTLPQRRPLIMPAGWRRRRSWWWSLSFNTSLVLLLLTAASTTTSAQQITGPPATTLPPPPGSSTTSWCVARSDASDQAMQAALDYACSAGADCAPIQQSGLCFLPNTLIAHASYAFNSYYQRKAMAPGSCNFAGTATVAKSDPSYGSCVYPSSLSTAGGATTTNAPPGGSTTIPGGAGSTSTNPTTNPYLNVPPPPLSTGITPFYGNGGGTTPGLGTGNVPPSPYSGAASGSSVASILTLLLLLLAILAVYQPNQ